VLPKVIAVMPDETNQALDALTMGIQGQFQIGATATAIGAILIAQSFLGDDFGNGVAEWLLSKPLSRTAYLMGKLIVHIAAVLLCVVLVPGAVGYAILSAVAEGALPLGPYALATLGVAVHTLFYLCLTTLLAVCMRKRGAVLGIMLPMVLLSQLWGMLLGRWIVLTPWGLFTGLAGALLGVELPAGLMAGWLAATALWSVLCVLGSLFCFRRTEL